MKIERYRPASDRLKPLIKYFWISTSPGPVDTHHKILPMANIDLLFNLSAPISYIKAGIPCTAPGRSFFSGLTTGHTLMKQKGPVCLVGTSFFPGGLYPFFKTPLSEFKGLTLGLDQVLGRQVTFLEEKLFAASGSQEMAQILEDFFLGLLSPDQADEAARAARLIAAFSASGARIRDFCHRAGIHPRTLERRFNTHAGTGPKQFQRLSRFQACLFEMTRPDASASQHSLTALAHHARFYDQPHFIKNFKRFTGTSPAAFLKERKAFIQVMKLA